MDWEISEWNVSSGSGNSIDLSSFIETLNTNAENFNFLGLTIDKQFNQCSLALMTGYIDDISWWHKFRYKLTSAHVVILHGAEVNI